MKNLKKTTDALEKAMNAVFTFCGFLAVAFVLVITVFLVISGIPAIGEIGITDFLFGTTWASTAAQPQYSILPFILTSVYGTAGAIVIAVPKEYEEASLALGATKTETVFKVVVPAAKSGILTAVVLGIGRARGEAMAVMMVAGNVANMPNLFQSVRFLTTAVASEMSYSSGLQRQALFSIALVLFVFIMIINLILNFVVKRGESNE